MVFVRLLVQMLLKDNPKELFQLEKEAEILTKGLRFDFVVDFD